MSFEGLRVLSLESRRAKEMETLIVREGGVPFVAPSGQARRGDAADGARPFVVQLEAGTFDMVCCRTAVGLNRLKATVAKQMPLDRLSAALRRVTIVSRGPKPVGVLKSLEVPIHIIIPEPNTWKEIVEIIAPR